MKLIILTLLSICGFALAQNKLPFGSKNNSIEISINNITTVNAGRVTVEVDPIPSWLIFHDQKRIIKELNSKSSSPVIFSFDVEKTAPVGQIEKLQFKITSLSGEQWTKEISIQVSAPENYELLQNFPNPYNPSTKIEFSIPKAGNTTLKVYDAIGREVTTLVNEVKEPGYYSVTMDGSRLSSGVYIYKLTSGSYSQIKKMMLVK